MKFLAFVLCVLPMLVGVWHPVLDSVLGCTVLPAELMSPRLDQLINGDLVACSSSRRVSLRSQRLQPWLSASSRAKSSTKLAKLLRARLCTETSYIRSRPLLQDPFAVQISDSIGTLYDQYARTYPGLHVASPVGGVGCGAKAL